jgi:hypothetical protein
VALKGKTSGFKYKPRTAEQVKGRASRKTSLFDSIIKQGIDTFRAKQGDNLYRYLPPTWDDSDHYGYTVFVHQNVGANNSTYLCLRKMLNKPCPICEAQKEAQDAGEAEEAKALRPNERIVSWIIDRDSDDPEKPLIYEQSWTQDRDIVSLCLNERTGEILMIDHPDKGFDVSFKRHGSGLKTKYASWAIARDDSPIHDSEKVQDEILSYVKDNPVPDVLNFYDYDYLQGVISGTVAEKDVALDKDDSDDQVPVPRSRRAPVEEDEVPVRRGPRRDQEVDDEDDEPAPVARKKAPVVEEDEDETPPPRRTSRKPEPVDEEVDEEGETPPPRSRSSGRSRVVEEDPEEGQEVPARRSSTRVR